MRLYPKQCYVFFIGNRMINLTDFFTWSHVYHCKNQLFWWGYTRVPGFWYVLMQTHVAIVCFHRSISMYMKGGNDTTSWLTFFRTDAETTLIGTSNQYTTIQVQIVQVARVVCLMRPNRSQPFAEDRTRGVHVIPFSLSLCFCLAQFIGRISQLFVFVFLLHGIYNKYKRHENACWVYASFVKCTIWDS